MLFQILERDRKVTSFTWRKRHGRKIYWIQDKAVACDGTIHSVFLPQRSKAPSKVCCKLMSRALAGVWYNFLLSDRGCMLKNGWITVDIHYLGRRRSL